MSVDAISVISIGAAFGGLVNGLAGFGTGLFALGWWLVVLPPKSAVALVVVLSLVSGVQGVFAVRHALNWPRVARFVIPALVGLPFGFAMLAHLNASMLKLLVGLIVTTPRSFASIGKATGLLIVPPVPPPACTSSRLPIGISVTALPSHSKLI